MENDDLHQNGLLTGDTTIDRQHEEIFRRAACLRTAIHEGRAAEEVGELLAFLDDYTRLHFTSEEAAMAREGFPDLVGQRREHTALLAAIQLLEHDFRAVGPSDAMTARVDQLIFKRFMQHIFKSDMAFATFMQARRPAALSDRAAT